MKQLLIFIFLIILNTGCKEKTVSENTTYGEHSDIVITKKDTTLTFNVSVDSFLYYFQKEMDSKLIRDSCEIAYLRTGKDYYRRRGNKYGDSIDYYYILSHAIAIKLKK
jgi:hypothetical protein